MITAADASFHDPDPPDPSWAETNYFGFYAPEVPLNGGVYTLFRPVMGVALSTVNLTTGWADAPWQADYWDAHVHLPMPPERNLCDYRLGNGLHVRVTTPPTSYVVDFDDGRGTEVHFTFDGLMQPFDINDPEQDPLALPRADGEPFAWGQAYSGHFDLTGRVRGEVRLRDRQFRLDCVTTMDHSWGLRSERHSHTMSWLHAHFSEDLVVHAILDFDADQGGRDLGLAHGYVLEAGRVLALKAGSGITQRAGWFPRRIELELIDCQDRVWRLQGESVTAFPWQAWPGVVGFNCLVRWKSEGRTGYGEIQDFLGYDMLCAAASRAPRPAAP